MSTQHLPDDHPTEFFRLAGPERMARLSPGRHGIPKYLQGGRDCVWIVAMHDRETYVSMKVNGRDANSVGFALAWAAGLRVGKGE